MSEDNNQNTSASNDGEYDDAMDGPIPPQMDPAVEREQLMTKARLMGLTFSGNIGNDTLRARIREHLEKQEEEPAVAQTNAFEAMSQGERAKAIVQERANDVQKVEKRIPFREKCRQDALRLVRCKIFNLDPKKQDLPGEIITVGNEYIGTVKKFIPFGERTENGYHIPHIIYEFLKGREFLNVKVTRGTNGVENVITRYVQEFSIEVMDPLTAEELAQLGQAQLAAGSIEQQTL